MGRVWDLIFDFAERGGMLCCRKLKENELLILSLFLLFFPSSSPPHTPAPAPPVLGYS